MRSSYKNLQRFAYLSRHRLLILLEWAETEIENFTRKRQVQIENNPRSPQSQGPGLIIDDSLLADPPLFSLPSTFNVRVS